MKEGEGGDLSTPPSSPFSPLSRVTVAEKYVLLPFLSRSPHLTQFDKARRALNLPIMLRQTNMRCRKRA